MPCAKSPKRFQCETNSLCMTHETIINIQRERMSRHASLSDDITHQNTRFHWFLSSREPSSSSVLNKRHHLEALGNKLIQILTFIPQSLEMMSFV